VNAFARGEGEERDGQECPSYWRRARSGPGLRGDSLRLGGGPEDFDFLFDGGEVLVAGGQGGFAVGG